MTQRQLLAELELIASIHSDIRGRLYRWPGDRAHFVNENTLVRLAAVLDAGGRKPSGKMIPRATWPEVCVRTVFLLRHMIVHLDGMYRPRKLRESSRKNLMPAFRKFRAKHTAAKVKQGEKLCLDADAVLDRLFTGCVDYVRGKR